jgi:hypothetical protein
VKRKGYFALACIAVIFACVAAKVFADSSAHVEDVDAGGVHHVYVPATQATDPAPLPRIEVFDLDGARRVFVLPATTQPSTRPTTQPADPSGRVRVSPGFDFSGKSGKFFAPNGTYPAFRPSSGLDVLGESRDGVVFSMPKGGVIAHGGREQRQAAELHDRREEAGRAAGPGQREGDVQAGHSVDAGRLHCKGRPRGERRLRRGGLPHLSGRVAARRLVGLWRQA